MPPKAKPFYLGLQKGGRGGEILITSVLDSLDPPHSLAHGHKPTASHSPQPMPSIPAPTVEILDTSTLLELSFSYALPLTLDLV